MLKFREGQKVPNVTIPIRVNGKWQKVDSDALFKGSTVVLFALPAPSRRPAPAGTCRVSTSWPVCSRPMASTA